MGGDDTQREPEWRGVHRRGEKRRGEMYLRLLLGPLETLALEPDLI